VIQKLLPYTQAYSLGLTAVIKLRVNWFPKSM